MPGNGAKKLLHTQEDSQRKVGSGSKSIVEIGRNKEVSSIPQSFISCLLYTEGITAVNEPRSDGPKGLGDFQRRSNRDRDRGWRGKQDYDRNRGHDQGQRGWDSTPKSNRSTFSRDAPSVRVPDVPWDSTPRSSREEGSGWGATRNRGWDAPTPRVARGGSPDGDDGALGIDAREWEEEQVRLDRDWYTGPEDGGVAGDEEHNPLAQYEDLSALKQVEIATKQVVSRRLYNHISSTLNSSRRKRYPQDRLNMCVFLTMLHSLKI